jgi:protein phosphatase
VGAGVSRQSDDGVRPHAVPSVEWLNRTINIDTGCVFGGELTALRYPELETISVPAAQAYAEPARPFLASSTQDDPERTAQQQHDDVLDLADVTGKRIVQTRLHPNITIREENSIAALEVMSRFAADPRWLIYLPPTMSPTETSREEGLLEHPREAFEYFAKAGVAQVVCEEKHMGSRAVVVLCRDEEAARRRFGVLEGSGVCYTRTGRRFFSDDALEEKVLAQLRSALDAASFWQQFETDWVCLDCELMPWSAKAQELLQRQYAPVGVASQLSLQAATRVLEGAAARGLDVAGWQANAQERLAAAQSYVALIATIAGMSIPLPI